MNTLKMNDFNSAEYKKINQSLRRGAVERNLKTAAVAGFAVSGAILGFPWLVATAATTSTVLAITQYRQSKKRRT
jgi:hypothetical protein